MSLGNSLPQVRDNDDAMVELLRIIAQNTSGLSQEDIREGDLSIEGDEITVEGGTDQDGNPIYTTTGPGGLLVEEENDWIEMEFGFTARIVNLRFDAPLLVGFRPPHNELNRQIPVDPEGDSPFTIGADQGISASQVWVRLHTEYIEEVIAPQDPDLAEEYASGALVHLIAKR